MFSVLMTVLFSTLAWGSHLTLDQTTSAPHRLEIVTSGTDALSLFLREIESARHTIDIETYVAKDDESFWLIINAAREKIRENVQVRLILDWYGSWLNKGTLGRKQICALVSDGFQIGFFNSQLNQILKRTHRKFVIVDERSVSSGGRNFSNLNFGLNSVQNRLDYTFTVTGEIAKTVSRSFEDYWSSPHLKHVLNCRQETLNYPDTSSLKGQLRAHPLSSQRFIVNHVRFLSDPPAKHPSSFMSSLSELFASSSSAIVETPDVYMGSQLSRLLRAFLEQRKSLKVLTNPPSRMGSFVSRMNGDYSLIKQGAQSWIKDTIFSEESAPLLDPLKKAAKWTMHNKAIIFDDLHVLLSSFNFNILSESFNTEAGFFFIDTPELVEYLKALHETRPYNPRTCSIW